MSVGPVMRTLAATLAMVIGCSACSNEFEEAAQPAATASTAPPVPQKKAAATAPVPTPTPAASPTPGNAAPSPSAAIHMLGKLLVAADARPEANAVVSSLSVSQALHLARAGARGRTLDAFDQTLWGGSHEGRGIDAAPASPRDVSVTFEVANAAYLAKTLVVKPAYLEQLKALGAGVEQVDFAASATLDQINDWFSKQTQGHIPKMLDQLPGEVRFVLANALYFKGAWQDAFDPAATVEAAFYSTPARKARLMNAKRVLRYGEFEGAQVVQLPFRGGDFNLWVILPPATPSAWLGDGSVLGRLLAADPLSPQPVDLALPRFEISGGGDFTDIVKSLGLAQAFTSCADFSGLSDEALQLGVVVHKATMKVDEEGAVATAATAVTGVRSAAVAGPTMRVDRPFVAVVVANATREPLVAAVVNDPGA